MRITGVQWRRAATGLVPIVVYAVLYGLGWIASLFLPSVIALPGHLPPAIDLPLSGVFVFIGIGGVATLVFLFVLWVQWVVGRR